MFLKSAHAYKVVLNWEDFKLDIHKPPNVWASTMSCGVRSANYMCKLVQGKQSWPMCNSLSCVIACRENEQHITGDIAFAARQYISATRDVHWLNTSVGVETNNFTGYQFIRKLAEFWYSRPSWNDIKMRYEINGIMWILYNSNYISYIFNNSLTPSAIAIV